VDYMRGGSTHHLAVAGTAGLDKRVGAVPTPRNFWRGKGPINGEGILVSGVRVYA
jgi:hypothetical protein